MNRKCFFVAVGAILTFALAACSGDSKNTVPPPAATTTAAASGAFTLDQLPALVARLEPSVVTVFTDLGQGSGIIWSSDGTIVTNNHVIANATTIAVQFADGKHAAAKVRAADAYSDTAVLSVARANLPVAKWATTTPAVGTFVVAIGDPLGFTNSASIGIVSGVNRNLPGSGDTPPIPDLLQTSAPISPGNSGGALVDDRGNVVGMTQAYLPPSTGAVSIGLAIPAPTVTDAVKQLLATGKVAHTYIGLGTVTLTPLIAQQLHLNVSFGAIVVTVDARGPAASAGIQPGDVITQLDNTPVQTAADFVLAVREHKAGDVVTLHYVRNGTSRTTKVTLTSRAL
jgi:S1-C subfamily serine protease